MLSYALWFFIGLIAAGALLLYGRQRQPNEERDLLALALVVAAAIYVGFALIWGDGSWLLIEVGGLLPYGLFAYLAKKSSVYWLALGWALHPLWDIWLHLVGPGRHIVPAWYAVACVSFDLLVAGYIVYRWHGQAAIVSVP